MKIFISCVCTANCLMVLENNFGHVMLNKAAFVEIQALEEKHFMIFFFLLSK